MRLYSGKIAALSEELVKALCQANDIECEDKREVARDLEAVFATYLEQERLASERAKEIIAARGMPPTEMPRIRKLAAEQLGIKIGDELLDYLLDQLVEMLMHSTNVDEVFVEDHELRRRMRAPLRKALDTDIEVEAEIRGKLRHVEEGTRTWEVEYRRLLSDIQRRKGLT